VTWAINEKGYSQRRACGLIGMEPKMYRYASRRPEDAGLRARLRALAAERRRFGYRRVHILLRREGMTLNHKKLFRLYREERLTVRRRGGRKRAEQLEAPAMGSMAGQAAEGLGTRAPMTLPQGANQRWSLDFVSDTLVDDRRFRVLVVVDDFTRECLALVSDTPLSGRRVARELDRLVELRFLVQTGGPDDRAVKGHLLLRSLEIATVCRLTSDFSLHASESGQCNEMTPNQCRMARAGLGLGVRELAEAAGVSTNTITRLEAGEELKPRTVAAVQAALELAGIEFIPENGGGAGVRLRKSSEGGSI
jgi:transposase InsO family protein/DNA-binding XRE family transcriptional regulator